MFRNIIVNSSLKFVRWKPIHVDIEPNPMPYTADLWKSRMPHRMKSAYEVTHDELPIDMHEWPTLESRLTQKEPKVVFEKIGYDLISTSRDQFVQRLKEYRLSKSSSIKRKLQREDKVELPVDKINDEWIADRYGLETIFSLAHHYGIFKDLLGSFEFYPTFPLQLVLSDNSVYSLGNLAYPSQMKTRPDIRFNFKPDMLYTCLLLNLDGNPLTDLFESSLQWMRINCKDGVDDNCQGKEIIQYIQPYPLRGIGYNRIVCIAFEQSHTLSFPKRSYRNIYDRSFDSISFFKDNSQTLIPVGLAYLQCKWDKSVTDVFHTHFECQEPIYEYDLEEESRPEQVDIPVDVPFNQYLDMYRDRKEINAEAMEAYLKNICPFRGNLNNVPFPHAEPISPHTPSWKKEEIEDMLSGYNQWAHMPKY